MIKVSVKDRLPKKNQIVCCWDVNNIKWICCYRSNRFGREGFYVDDVSELIEDIEYWLDENEPNEDTKRLDWLENNLQDTIDISILQNIGRTLREYIDKQIK
jgi:hypothetical protein